MFSIAGCILLLLLVLLLRALCVYSESKQKNGLLSLITETTLCQISDLQQIKKTPAQQRQATQTTMHAGRPFATSDLWWVGDC